MYWDKAIQPKDIAGTLSNTEGQLKCNRETVIVLSDGDYFVNPPIYLRRTLSDVAQVSEPKTQRPKKLAGLSLEQYRQLESREELFKRG